MPHDRAALCLLAAATIAACTRGPRVEVPAPGARPLAAYGAQRVALAPVASVRVDSRGWITELGGAPAIARRLDTLIANALSTRGVGQSWILSTELLRAYERNRSYATDPYRLAVDPLRAETFVAASHYGEPLASQLRTMVALHDDARVVLIPVELRVEYVGTGGRALLRTALLDARLAEARWVGEVHGDTANTPARALESVAARFADLFLAP